MGTFRKILLFLMTTIIIWISWKIHNFIAFNDVPKIKEILWSENNDITIEPFQINISDAVLEDLKLRLEMVRPFAEPFEGTNHEYGLNTHLLQEIVDYWKFKYDWRAREKYLNKYPQFKTNIQGLNIHYLHIKPNINGTNFKVVPLLLCHGWPKSVREFYDIIPYLIEPRPNYNFVFELIVPSIPGYGFSDPSPKPGLSATQIAVILKNLMLRLGFKKFYLQGGDLGAIIFKSLAILYPEHVLGYHSNFCQGLSRRSFLKIALGSIYPNWVIDEKHQKHLYPLKDYLSLLLRESGYFHEHATKPDTLGVGLGDSPVALAAYILEKFIIGTDSGLIYQKNGGLNEFYSYDTLLDNIMIYWITGSIPTAIRLYSETFNRVHLALGIENQPIVPPTACAVFRHDIQTPAGVLKDTYINLVHLAFYNYGHFAAMQVPDVLALDVFLAVQKFENFHSEPQ